ncbi:hypothetical protein [Gluconacetobacter takamatsuzukensis]|uniref:Uncharacterized protein n=1 Tax=Gluconacetobacter takamatsuzukensis TaxID=1286190 RepID=A0A7W4PNF6_9PROT|nr:hypothetical protein [Gluconacetobacter takamatsuzukensis]MBB2204053.1 hypothetical protein [Gluconacetobacter takamatsuzukensis]
MAENRQDESMPYPSSLARTNARLTAALDRGALFLTAPLRRMGLDVAPIDPQSRPPRLAPKLWIVLTVCTIMTLLALWQVLGHAHNWATSLVWAPIFLSLGTLTSFRSRHPILRKPAEDRTGVERRIVAQCWLAASLTAAALACAGLMLVALDVTTASTIDGLDLGRRILMGLVLIEYLAIVAPVAVLSWHDHRAGQAL